MTDMTKVTYRISTETPFAFIEVVEEFDGVTDPITTKRSYDNLMGMFKEGEYGPGLTDKDFNKALDEFLTTGTLVDGADIYAGMNPSQQNVFQQIKKSLKRTKNDIV